PIPLGQPLANQPGLLDIARFGIEPPANLILTHLLQLPPDLLPRLAHHSRAPALCGTATTRRGEADAGVDPGRGTRARKATPEEGEAGNPGEQENEWTSGSTPPGSGPGGLLRS